MVMNEKDQVNGDRRNLIEVMKFVIDKRTLVKNLYEMGRNNGLDISFAAISKVRCT